MRLDEIMKQPLCEMSYGRAKAESIITGLEKPINLHLIKLLVVASQSADATHWRHELSTWLIDIADIRLKPGGKPGPASFYFRILFEEPYGDHEVSNVEKQMRRLSRNYVVKPDVDSNTVVAALKNFHMKFAAACATGTLEDTAVEAMIAAFPNPAG